jgi:hypothetical protein
VTTASELLLKAADIIKEQGLNKNGRYFGDDGSCCTLGALSRAEELLPGSFRVAHHAARDAVLGQLHQDYGQWWIVLWNDSPERTADDVITLLRRAAEAVA